MDSTDGFPNREDDGLRHEEIRAWSEEKYKLVKFYAALFCKSMKGKWGTLVYIDIFAGPGRSKIDHKRNIDAPPLLVLNSEHKFDKYIFNDIEKEKYEALKQRVSQYSNYADICVMNEDVNSSARKVLNEIPPYSRTNTVLAFCFVDPYRIENLKFETMKILSERFMDFLVLIPTGMDINRNVSFYEKPNNKKIEEFLGNPDWRIEWDQHKEVLVKNKNSNVNFGDFIAERFSESMKGLQYPYVGLENTKLIRSDDKNLPLYRLAFYSKNNLANHFWQQSVRYTSPQREMNF